MHSRLLRHVSCWIAAACVCVVSAASFAQNTTSEHPDSRVDIYGGYGFFHPLNSGIDGKQYVDDYLPPNATASVTGYFNHFFGAQIEGGFFNGGNLQKPNFPACFQSQCNQLIYTAEAGPVLRYPLGSWVPFIHALGGGERTNGPAGQNLKWGWGVTGGIGVDYVFPIFGNHLAVRLIQADYQYSQVVYGPLVLPAGNYGGFGEIDALKLSAGLVFRVGEKVDKVPVSMACSAEPSLVHPGDLVTITGSTASLDPRLKVVYSWASTGGKLVPSGPVATVDTTDLGPGDYTVTGHVSQGPKPRQQASCAAPFTVRPYDPPTISCSANPTTGVSGTPIAITASAMSPQNRPLTYSYATTAGEIAGTGASASLTTAGLDAQQITVTCNVADDLGHSASAVAQVSITKPPVPVVPETQALCGLSFTRDKRRPVRVDNEMKACLDDIALTLNQQSDAKLVVVGNASPDENPEAAAERTLNIRQYLTVEKGIDPTRIEVRVGDTSGRTAASTLVPAGAIFNDANTESFDENSIHRSGQAYGVTHGAPAKAPREVTPKHRRRRDGAMTGQSYPPGAASADPASPAPASADTSAAPAMPPPGGSTLSQLPH